MKRFFFLIMVCMSFYACKPGIPKDIIQPEEMQKVLIDVHIVDGYIATLPGADTAKKVASGYYNGIYRKFGIDSVVYNKSMDYYYKNPNLMRKLYDSVTVKLSQLKESYAAVDMIQQSADSFKGIFDENALDSTSVDVLLNRKYNNRILKKNVFVNLINPQVLILTSPTTTAQPTVVPTPPVEEVKAPETIQKSPQQQ